MAIGRGDKYLTPSMAMAGDLVVVTKGAAIEASAIMANTFKETVRRRLGSAVFKEAFDMFYQMSPVEDALAAVEVGVRDEGVTSMHDATECGVIRWVFEVARAAGKGIYLVRDHIPVADCVKHICDFFDMDPYTSISEGTLIVTVRPNKADELVTVVRDRGINAAVVGEITDTKEFWIEEHGQKRPLIHPVTDPFSQAFDKAMRAGLS